MIFSPEVERYLERRADVQLERAKLAALNGRAGLAARKNVEWAQIDEALELRLESAAVELALQQAAHGDDQAGAALERAAEIDEAFVNEVALIRRAPRKAAEPLAPDPPEPLAAVRIELAARRAAGEPFAAAWAEAVGQLHPNGLWKRALLATVEHWRHAYEGEADSAGGAIADAHEPGGEWGERALERVA